MSDLIALANSDFNSDLWTDLYKENPEVAEALHYLLLMEKHGGRDADGKQRNPKDVNVAVAKELGYSVEKLATNRRKWTNSEALVEARAFLQPIRAEADMALADEIKGIWHEIVMRAVEETLKPGNNIYAIIAGAQFLSSAVLNPANANQRESGNADQEYADRMKQLEIDEAQDYMNKNGG